jgi:hypothetical protein
LFRHISGIVKTDDEFWRAAADVVKVTNPRISMLYKLESDICPMGILYDAMDIGKEDIKRNLSGRHGDSWAEVDRIWDGYLYSPLPAAAHILNSRIFYSDRFHHDAGISSGVTRCITQLGRVHCDPIKAAIQLETYQHKLGSFDSVPAFHNKALFSTRVFCGISGNNPLEYWVKPLPSPNPHKTPPTIH